MNRLSVTGLTKSFGCIKVLDNVSLNLQTGDILGVFGRNGCGKSTLLKILFGTVKANAINMLINNNPLKAKHIIPNGVIAYLPQDPFLPNNLKVRNVIPMYFNDGDLQDKIFFAPGIPKIANTRVGNLSMGELRYLELLLVGNLNHPFLMLDEPFSMVEPLYKERIKEFLNQLKTTKGIIVTDHYYRDILSVSTSNILLKDGKTITITTENQLITEGYLPESLLNQ
ncbi:ABC transporter ATP-binding protein [Flavobacterium rivuli WB 3.3-2 = DSM 21788]|uniref:ABC transporter ATP-binding protein n=1 Tax=Flavobacterium rivuli WB 3.3-2 = DSM 21788 TaxID=1121895 RepID=A0A0A2M897_9FLAO|nr:ATP-binding cassette domain-containing protein [Flavobacterium rivuli]KGO88499.1 ABC transporter ATP-binding protein [Flavobacterium rivuli WB 3.3-2 = DSM 21788]